MSELKALELRCSQMCTSTTSSVLSTGIEPICQEWKSCILTVRWTQKMWSQVTLGISHWNMCLSIFVYFKTKYLEQVWPTSEVVNFSYKTLCSRSRHHKGCNVGKTGFEPAVILGPKPSAFDLWATSLFEQLKANYTSNDVPNLPRSLTINNKEVHFSEVLTDVQQL